MRIKSTLCVLALAGAAVVGVSFTTQQAQAVSVDQVASGLEAGATATPSRANGSFRSHGGGFRFANGHRNYRSHRQYGHYRHNHGYGWYRGYRQHQNYRHYYGYGWYRGYGSFGGGNGGGNCDLEMQYGMMMDR